MAKTRAHVALLVDRSGSMWQIREEAESGVRNFLAEQRKLDSVKVTVSLFHFDEFYERVYGPVKTVDAPAYELKPRGGTALYDAIGHAITDTRVDLEKATVAGKEPDKVVLVIMTDGRENRSREFSFEAMTALIEAQKKAGWQIVFLAGTPDSVAIGHASGLTTTSYDPHTKGSTRAVYNAASTATMDYFVGAASSVVMPDDVQADKEDDQKNGAKTGA